MKPFLIALGVFGGFVIMFALFGVASSPVAQNKPPPQTRSVPTPVPTVHPMIQAWAKPGDLTYAQLMMAVAKSSMGEAQYKADTAEVCGMLKHDYEATVANQANRPAILQGKVQAEPYQVLMEQYLWPVPQRKTVFSTALAECPQWLVIIARPCGYGDELRDKVERCS